MKKISLFLVILTLLITTGCANKSTSKNWPEICLHQTCFSIQLAKTEQEREYGLMNRTSLPELSWMLFIFDTEDYRTFWMKDTLIPLDMIWIDSWLNIVWIREADPCTQDPCPIYNPGKTASYVLELNKWISAKYGIKVWDKAELSLE
jgi:uncharacterized membrane protein (UPF0127 family)